MRVRNVLLSAGGISLVCVSVGLLAAIYVSNLPEGVGGATELERR